MQICLLRNLTKLLRAAATPGSRTAPRPALSSGDGRQLANGQAAEDTEASAEEAAPDVTHSSALAGLASHPAFAHCLHSSLLLVLTIASS